MFKMSFVFYIKLNKTKLTGVLSNVYTYMYVLYNVNNIITLCKT